MNTSWKFQGCSLIYTGMAKYLDIPVLLLTVGTLLSASFRFTVSNVSNIIPTDCMPTVQGQTSTDIRKEPWWCTSSTWSLLGRRWCWTSSDVMTSACFCWRQVTTKASRQSLSSWMVKSWRCKATICQLWQESHTEEMWKSPAGRLALSWSPMPNLRCACLSLHINLGPNKIRLVYRVSKLIFKYQLDLKSCILLLSFIANLKW